MGTVKEYHKTGKAGAAIKPPYIVIDGVGKIKAATRAKWRININDWFKLTAILKNGIDCEYCNYKGVCCDKNVLDRTTCLDNLDRIRDQNVLNKEV